MKTSTYLLTCSFLLFFIRQTYCEPVDIGKNGSVDIKPGVITDSVNCQNAEQHYYAVFVPSGYNENTSWPILYFFEPAARGKLPLTLYQEVAEEHGLILACSYNSRNGPIKANELAYKTMSADIESRLNINTESVYVSGFSGGGRFSQYLAQNDEKIAGVISVAGPKGDGILFDPGIYSTSYTGIVGTKDMNYLEHRQFQEILNKASVPNALFTYTAAHQWPPKEVYALAIRWHIAQEDFTNNNEASPIADEYVQNRMIEIDTTSYYSFGDRYRSYRSLLRNFGQTDKFGISNKLDEIESDKTYKKEKKQEQNILNNEQSRQLEHVKALSEFRKYHFQIDVNPDSAKYSMQWWKSEIGRLKSKAKQNDAKGLSNARMIDFLRGQVHNQVANAKVLNKADLILSMHEINLLLYPNSVWFNWQHAILLAQYEGEKQATAYLKQSKKINQGLLNQIRQNPAFAGLKSKYAYLFD